MCQNAIKYLEQNKDKYARESLVSSLQNAGYEEKDIAAAVSAVYGKNTLETEKRRVPFDFLNFRDRLEYKTSLEKFRDFFFGLIATLAIIMGTTLLIGEGAVLSYLVIVFLIIYFSSRRIFLLIGLVIGLFLGLAAHSIVMDSISNSIMDFDIFLF